MTAPTKGAIYLNLTWGSIFHGYNCGAHFFTYQTAAPGQKLNNTTPLWKTFSSKIPTPAYRTAENVLRILEPHSCQSSVEKNLLTAISEPKEDSDVRFFRMVTNGELDMAHPVLRLSENEREEFMSRISRALTHLPGRLETWVGWSEQREGGKDTIVLFDLEGGIVNLVSWVQSVISACWDELDMLDPDDESGDKEQMKQKILNFGMYMDEPVRWAKYVNTALCANWQRH